MRHYTSNFIKPLMYRLGNDESAIRKSDSRTENKAGRGRSEGNRRGCKVRIEPHTDKPRQASCSLHTLQEQDGQSKARKIEGRQDGLSELKLTYPFLSKLLLTLFYVDAIDSSPYWAISMLKELWNEPR